MSFQIIPWNLTVTRFSVEIVMREEHFGVVSSQDRLSYAVETNQSPHLSTFTEKGFNFHPFNASCMSVLRGSKVEGFAPSSYSDPG